MKQKKRKYKKKELELIDQNKKKGTITVEAIIVLPIFLLVIFFIINFFNIFYTHLVMYQALDNVGAVLAQYGHVVDEVVGLEHFGLNKETKELEKNISTNLNQMLDSGKSLIDDLNQGINFSTIPQILENGKDFTNNVKIFAGTIQSVDGTEIVNYLVSSAIDGAGGYLVELLIGDYLQQMQVNQELLNGKIRYKVYVDVNGISGQKNDMILIAYYDYKNPMFSIFLDEIHLKQTIRIHPWVGAVKN